MTATHLLSLAIWLPIIGGLLVLATGSDRNAAQARGLALVTALLGFLVTIPLYTGFDVTKSGMQFIELSPWIPRFNINYSLGVDGISVPGAITPVATVLVILAAAGRPVAAASQCWPASVVL